MDYLLPILGILICVLALGQFFWWSTLAIRTHQRRSHQIDQRQKELRGEIDLKFRKTKTQQDVRWEGFRKFLVEKIVAEDEQASSVYLMPEDQKPLPCFQPGQHLTFQFQIPGKSKPVVRCYSLSDAPNPKYYRITVKRCPAPHNNPNAPQGLVSHFINDQLSMGDVVDVKAPNGSFHLDLSRSNSIVLMAGGVGITPMMSMINTLLNQNSERQILLVYGVTNSTQHTFQSTLRDLSSQFSNLKVMTFYSQPLEDDLQGVDYDLPGYAKADILAPIFSNSQLEYYMCGPPPFMNGIYDCLIQHGVDDARIHFEAFGPASVKRVGSPSEKTATHSKDKKKLSIEFSQSQQNLNWNHEFESLLELAEANHVEIDSGCRAGNCGTCELTLLQGEVEHPEHVKIESGKCLACVARPKTDLRIEA